jgi:2-acylglycerol O-acyltransferase 2
MKLLAPLKIPIERRIQTLSVLIFVLLFLQFFAIITLYTLIRLLFTDYFWIPLSYAAWLYFDWEKPREGGRLKKWIRNLKIWKYYADYFPIHLIKTCDLDPKRNYLMCVSPHGILCFGIFGNFGTEATNFSEKYPGITPHILTLNAQFISPLTRDLLLLGGICSASEKSIKYILGNKGENCKEKGQAAILVIGGVAEMLEVQVDSYTLVLKKRTGFVRLALETGTPLVPIFSFGENNSYYTFNSKKETSFKKFQTWWKDLFTFKFPIFYGRGIFNYKFGWLPFRDPIYTVVGRPIEIPKIEKPTKEDIDKYHEIYLNELTQLFNEHKDKYLKNKNTVLEII